MRTDSLLASPITRVLFLRRGAWLDWLRLCVQAIRTRRQLAELDDRLLSDIGISRVDALKEASRAPWDLTPPRR